jgi:hypothetical protein
MKSGGAAAGLAHPDRQSPARKKWYHDELFSTIWFSSDAS